MSIRINIPPEKLIWATERSGLTVDSLEDVYPKALNWIRNESLPTFNQLQDFAKKLHVPFGFLFLENTPEEKIPITFFRSNGDVVKNPPLVVKDLVSELKKKQDWLADYLNEQKIEELSFVGSLKDFSNIRIEDAANIIREALNIESSWFTNTNKSGVFRYLIDIIESNRIFVISSGFHKHNKRPIDVDICKGFTLINNLCPFIYINTNNLGGGRIFTLIHELVHVFVGNSIGISYEPIKPSSYPLEKFCDEVASEILVSTSLFEFSWDYNITIQTNIHNLSSKFLVSKLVILKKAFDNSIIDKAQFWDLYNQYTKPFEKFKKPGGDYWNSKPYEVSRKFYTYVEGALKQGKILPSDAYRLTNMKGNTFNKFRESS